MKKFDKLIRIIDLFAVVIALLCIMVLDAIIDLFYSLFYKNGKC